MQPPFTRYDFKSIGRLAASSTTPWPAFFFCVKRETLSAAPSDTGRRKTHLESRLQTIVTILDQDRNCSQIFPKTRITEVLRTSIVLLSFLYEWTDECSSSLTHEIILSSRTPPHVDDTCTRSVKGAVLRSFFFKRQKMTASSSLQSSASPFLVYDHRPSQYIYIYWGVKDGKRITKWMFMTYFLVVVSSDNCSVDQCSDCRGRKVFLVADSTAICHRLLTGKTF